MRPYLLGRVLIPVIAAKGKINEKDMIDVHIHGLTPSFVAAIEANGGESTGILVPNWTPELAVASLDSTGSSLGILSASAPGASIVGIGQEARQLARAINQELAGYSTDPKFKNRLGFFGSLPDWQDVNGTLAELDFLFAEQKLASGVIVLSSYGTLLPGHPNFRPIWKKLQEYNALIFLHPTFFNGTPPRSGGLPPGGLPLHFIDFPFATTRAATDLIFNSILQDFPDIDIILSHAGGTLPYLGFRIETAMLSPLSSSSNVTNLTLEQVKTDFGRFYHDLAFSTSDAQLDGLLDFTHPSRILFGTDFPYLAKKALSAVVQQYHHFVATNPRGKLLAPSVLRKNAVLLLNKHAPAG